LKPYLATNGKLDIERYRKIMSYPLWGFFCQAVHATRSYEEGLECGRLLVDFTKDNADSLSETEHTRNLKALYRFVLSMLDSLDRWDEYLTTWETMRATLSFTDNYPKNEWNLRDPNLRAFILREDAQLHVHFLWPTFERKLIIERKRDRERRGKKVGHLLHKQKSDLSPEDTRQRMESLTVKMIYVEKVMALIDLARRQTGL